jgi:hypothetical protein
VTTHNHLTTTTKTPPTFNKCINNPTKKNYTYSDVKGKLNDLNDWEQKHATYGKSLPILLFNREEAYGFSGKGTMPKQSNKEGGPGTPSSFTEKTIIGLAVALPRQAITLTTISPDFPCLPPVRPRTQQSNNYQQQQQQINFWKLSTYIITNKT